MLTSLALALALVAGAPAAPARDAADPLPAKAETALRAQALRLFNAWLRGADEDFVNALYPGLVRELGGKPKAVGIIRAQRTEFEKAGLRTIDVTVGKVRACARPGKELQCVIEGSQVMRSPQGRITLQTATIGFSKDGGATWTFLSISSDGDVRKMFPEVSAALPLALDENPIVEPEGAAAGADPAPAAVTP